MITFVSDEMQCSRVLLFVTVAHADTPRFILPGDRVLQPTLAIRQVACDWVRASRVRWAAWLPAICPPGFAADATLTACFACPPGYHCRGGPDPGQPCPRGSFCPSGAPVPLSCPSGRSTAGPGAEDAGDCNECLAGLVPVAGLGCVETVLLVPAVLGLAVVLVLVAVAVVVERRRHQAAAEEALKTDEEREREAAMQRLRMNLRITAKEGSVSLPFLAFLARSSLPFLCFSPRSFKREREATFCACRRS
jgi:hypothetical protein